jgi:hypothetical protein
MMPAADGYHYRGEGNNQRWAASAGEPAGWRSFDFNAVQQETQSFDEARRAAAAGSRSGGGGGRQEHQGAGARAEPRYRGAAHAAAAYDREEGGRRGGTQSYQTSGDLIKHGYVQQFCILVFKNKRSRLNVHIFFRW